MSSLQGNIIASLQILPKISFSVSRLGRLNAHSLSGHQQEFNDSHKWRVMERWKWHHVPDIPSFCPEGHAPCSCSRRVPPSSSPPRFVVSQPGAVEQQLRPFLHQGRTLSASLQAPSIMVHHVRHGPSCRTYRSLPEVE